jgi:hypothetical protein
MHAPISDEAWFEAENKLYLLLRSYVDQWIDSGRYEHGETPAARGLKPATAKALNSYVKRSPPTIKFYEFMRVAPSVTFGEQNFYQEPGHELMDPITFAATEATRLFSLLLLSDQGKTLCKCRYKPCGKYFQIQNVRTIYVRGPYCCSAHNRADSAVQLTAIRRNQCLQRLIQLTAEKSLYWETKSEHWKQRNSPMKMWLVQQVNTCIAEDPRQKRDAIKPNWLAWNSSKIKQRVKELRGELSTRNSGYQTDQVAAVRRTLSCGHEETVVQSGKFIKMFAQVGMDAKEIADYSPSANCRKCRDNYVASLEPLRPRTLRSL